MIEIKDPEESNQILRKYTVSERIFEQVRDFRTTRTKDKNKPKELLQRGIIMSIDLPKMSQHYKEKKKELLQKSVAGKEQPNAAAKKVALDDVHDNMLTVPHNLKTVSRKLQENDQPATSKPNDGTEDQDEHQLSMTSNQTQGNSSYRDIVFKRSQQKSKTASTLPITSADDIDGLFSLQGVNSKTTPKYVEQPVSSAGMIMRTSFKIRFELSKKNFLGLGDKDQFNLSKKIMQQKEQSNSENRIKKALKKSLDKVNSRKPFVEFPIHLMHEDSPEPFIAPLDR